MERKRVLIVDDEMNARHALAAILWDEGYDVECAETAAAALDLVDSFDPHVVITDLIMPGLLDGFDVVRSVHDRRKIPVIAMTAYDYAGKQALSLGASSCLSKPLDLDALLSATEDLLGLRLFQD